MENSDLPTIQSEPAEHILHPTDFTEQSDVALAHALRLALTNKAQLYLMHVGKDTRKEWHEFPSIRKYLQRWGVIEEGESRSAVSKLGIRIEKVIGTGSSVTDAIAGYCNRHPIDMLVLATAARGGVAAHRRSSPHFAREPPCSSPVRVDSQSNASARINSAYLLSRIPHRKPKIR